jgi:DNA-binding transcriptional ArsR family regulator
MEAKLMRALGDETRLAIFESLSRGEQTVTQLTSQFNVSQPAISQHLRVLKQCRLVRKRREGRFAHYVASPEELQPIVHWLAHYQEFWPQKLQKLKTVLKENKL